MLLLCPGPCPHTNLLKAVAQAQIPANQAQSSSPATGSYAHTPAEEWGGAGGKYIITEAAPSGLAPALIHR